MRKLWALMVLLLLPLTFVQARETRQQAPIIGLSQDKLYAVSPIDGAARLLAEAVVKEQPIAPLRVGTLSPDGKQMLYLTQSTPDVPPDVYGSHIYVVALDSAKVDEIVPSGGVFDVPAPTGYVFQLDLPTWSRDGQRIYYVRYLFDPVNFAGRKPTQLAYFDVNTRQHTLVARLDPKNLIENLQAIDGGMLVRWYETGFENPTFSTLYTLDNQAGDPVEAKQTHLYAVRDADGLYYARLNDYGDIHTLVDVANGHEKPAATGSYPAAQSFGNDKDSMHIFSVQTDINRFYIYGSDYHASITSIDNESGFRYALAPDGQSMAYLLFGSEQRAPIKIMDMKGNVHTLDFEAEQILWGATEFVPFYAPG